MSEEIVAKDLVKAPEKAIAKRSKATLVPIGKGFICDRRQFVPSLALSYIIARPGGVTVAELAKVFAGAATIEGKRRVRKNMHAVVALGLAAGVFIVYHLAAMTGRIESVKILDVTSPMECQAARDQLERMRKRRDWTREKCERAEQIISAEIAARQEVSA
jgi:hypothetical protein